MDNSDGRKGLDVPSNDDFLRLIFESATDFAIFSTDPKGLVTSWNVGAERVIGYRDDEIIGQSANVIFPPDEGGTAAAEEERQIALKEGRAEDERWQMRKDGSRFWASGLLMPMADRKVGFLKILRDRTEQHLAEARLRENEERFRLLATNIPQLVFRSRGNGERTWGSPQWIDFTGLSLEESLQLGWLDAVHADDREPTLTAWQEAQSTGEYYVEHRVLRGSDGEYRWHQTRARPLAGSDGEWIGTMTDVHDMHGLQERQQALMAELQHRTRNLLAVVQSIANQTLRTNDSLRTFGQMFESRLHALSRVQSLLVRADQGNIDLRELISAELTAHGGGEAESGKVLANGPSIALPANSGQALGLALHELATNAVKYGALSQPSGKLRLVWRVEKEGAKRRVALEWVESGVAMPGGAQPRRKGYGSELIERVLPYQLGAKTRLEFGPDGVRCAIWVPVKKLQGDATDD